MYDVHPTDDGALLVGQVITRDASHGWLAAVDDAGRRQWERVFDDGAGFRAVEPAMDDRGGEPGSEASGALVCGSTNVVDAPEAGARNGDPYCARVDSEGTAEWRLTYQTDRSFGGTYGGPDDDGEIGGSGRLQDVTSTGDGYVIAGHLSEDDEDGGIPAAMGLDEHGDVEWRWRHPDEERGTVWSLTPAGDDVVAAGSPRSDAREGESPWVARLDGDGETAWYEPIPDGTELEESASLATVSGRDGTLLVAGTRERGGVALVGVDGTDGTERWRSTVDVDGATHVEDVVATDDGYVLAGTRETEDGREAWLHSIGADGDSRWSEAVGEGRRTRGHVLAVADDGGLLVGGETTDDSTLAWLAKLGGDEPEDGSGWGLETPSLPGWTTTFAVGVGVGAGLVGAASRLRRGRPTSTDAAARSSEPSASRADE